MDGLVIVPFRTFVSTVGLMCTAAICCCCVRCVHGKHPKKLLMLFVLIFTNPSLVRLVLGPSYRLGSQKIAWLSWVFLKIKLLCFSAPRFLRRVRLHGPTAYFTCCRR